MCIYIYIYTHIHIHIHIHTHGESRKTSGVVAASWHVGTPVARCVGMPGSLVHRYIGGLVCW